MVLPNFICIGAQKSGTTTLHDILKQHPEIYLPKNKEAYFFHQDKVYEKGIKWWSNEHFNTYRGEKRIGVITPEYLYCEKSAQRIAKDLGKDIKVIILLRNPIDRAYSHYLMSVRRGFEKKSFQDAIEIESERIKEDEFRWSHFSYLSRGLYAKQLKHVFKYLNKQNTRVYIFETDFLKKKEAMINDIIGFLGLSIDSNIEINLKSNSSTKPRFDFIRDIVFVKSSLLSIVGRVLIPNKKIRWKFKDWVFDKNQKRFDYEKLPLDVKKNLYEKFFKNDINELETLLNKDLSSWKKF